MNPFTSIIRHFYSVEKKTSLDQLRDDFGCFPPAPLRCDRLNGEFSVVKIRGIGEIYQSVAMSMQLLDADVQELSTDLLALFDPAELHTLRKALNDLDPRSSRIAERLAFCCLFVVESVRTIRNGPKRPRVRGYFIPALQDESRIFVKVGGIHRHKNPASVISHEHIHLLQHKDSERHSKHARSPETLLSESGLAEPFWLYVLQKIEVEARLHESVLSFYRSHHRLPLTVPKFIGMLAASQKLGEYVRLILNCSGVIFEQDVNSYPEREDMFAGDLESILVYCQTFEIARRFITEVLPVMYGNLLRYYGDEMASQNFLKNIERPNLYDELYGLSASGLGSRAAHRMEPV